MRLTILAILAATVFLGEPALALGPQDVYGVWRQPESGSVMQIYSCQEAICAKAVSQPGDAGKDIKNPDQRLRDRALAGVETWRHAKATAPLQWSGMAYDPANGATVYGTLHLTGDSELVVASCNLDAMPCVERMWRKVLSEVAGDFTTLVAQATPGGAAAKIIQRRASYRVRLHRASQPEAATAVAEAPPRRRIRSHKAPARHNAEEGETANAADAGNSANNAGNRGIFSGLMNW
jgi:uncharacterized protein (DUF2147 family)